MNMAVARMNWATQCVASWRQWFKLYGADLVPIVPPWAQIAAGSTLEVAALGKAPGVLTPDGWMGAAKWQQMQMTADDAEQFGQGGEAGIGLHCRRCLAFDVDLASDEDEDTAARIRGVLEAQLGTTMTRRRGNSARVLLLYRQREGAPILGKRVISIRSHMTSQLQAKVEVLTQGQQAVVAGVHKSGALYAFDRIVAPDALREVGPDDIDRVVETLANVLGTAGLDVEDHQHQPSGKRRLLTDESLRAGNLDLLAEAIRCIPNDHQPSYDRWFRQLVAIKAACGGDEWFYELVVEPWCLLWPKNTPEVVRAKWDSIVEATIGADVIEAEARSFGWSGPPLRTVFAPIEAPALPVEAPPPALPADEDWLAPSATLDRTDDRSCAFDFVGLPLAETFLYAPWASAKWLRRDGAVWIDDPGTPALLRSALLNFLTSHRTPKLAMSHKADTVAAALAGLRLERPAAFDSDPLVLNTPGGVVDLATGRLRPHAPADRFLMQTRVAPGDPDLCPLFDRCLLEWADGDPSLARALVESAASALLGRPAEHRVFNVYGEGGNGKSLFIGLVSWLLGDYAATAAPSAFAESRVEGGKARSDIATLAGRRMIAVNEPKETTIDVEFIKAWSGGDLITARGLWESETSFYGGSLFFLTNHPFKVRRVDLGLARRMRVLPFNATFAEDNTLMARLQAEGPGILARLIEVCAETHGRATQSVAVLDATADALDSADPWRVLVRRAFEITRRPSDSLTSAEITAALRVEADRGEPEDRELMIGLTDRAVMMAAASALRGLGCLRSRVDNRARAYRGLRLAWCH